MGIRIQNLTPATSLADTDRLVVEQQSSAQTRYITVGNARTSLVADPIRIGNGTEAEPAYSFTSATGSGMWHIGSGAVGFSAGGNLRLSLGAAEVVVNDDGDDVDFRVEGNADANLLFTDASADNVGIGTGAPNSGAKVHIAGSGIVNQNAGLCRVTVDRNTTPGGYAELGAGGSNAGFFFEQAYRFAIVETTDTDPFAISRTTGRDYINLFDDDIIFGRIGVKAISFRTHATGTPVTGSGTERMLIAGSGVVVVGDTANADGDAPLEVICHSTFGNAAIALKQLDDNEPFIDFQGTAAADATKNISTLTAGNSIQRFARVSSGGADYWIPLYDAPTS